MQGYVRDISREHVFVLDIITCHTTFAQFHVETIVLSVYTLAHYCTLLLHHTCTPPPCHIQVKFTHFWYKRTTQKFSINY